MYVYAAMRIRQRERKSVLRPSVFSYKENAGLEEKMACRVPTPFSPIKYTGENGIHALSQTFSPQSCFCWQKKRTQTFPSPGKEILFGFQPCENPGMSCAKMGTVPTPLFAVFSFYLFQSFCSYGKLLLKGAPGTCALSPQLWRRSRLWLLR